MRQNVPYYEADCCMIKKKKKELYTICIQTSLCAVIK